MKKEKLMVVILLVSLLVPPGLAQQVTASQPIGAGLRPQATTIHVDAAATGPGTGVDWENAYTDLQTALGAAVSGDEVWVAQGTYYPTAGSDRSVSFALASGVEIYGGFPTGGSAFEGRDPEAYPTVLSGDIGTGGDYNDNSYHVVLGSGTDATARLDGFTIRDGRADCAFPCYGAGMYITNAGSPTIANCVFRDNTTPDYGGGMAAYDSSPTILNVIFEDNSAGGFGGGLFNHNSTTKVYNAAFYHNTTSFYGGAIYNQTNSNITVVNAIFSGNWAQHKGGGIYNNSSSPMLRNLTFYGNSSTTDRGGGIHNASSFPNIVNAVMWNNSDSSGANDIYNNASVTAISYSLTQDGVAGTGNISADPLFLDPDGADDVLGTLDDDLRLGPVSPAIDAGDNTAVPADAADLDDDGNTTEVVPLDLDLQDRFQDTSVLDTGNGTAPIVDMGAYERPRSCYARLNDSPTDYSSVQAAVDASTSSTDLVKVAGTCYGVNVTGGLTQTVYLSKTLTVQGGYTETFAGPPDPVAYPTVLDALEMGRVMYITGDHSAQVEGLHITGGNAQGLGGWGQFGERDGGGGVYIITATATISSCWISNNTAEAGGGIALGMSGATVYGSEISGNTADGAEGAGLAVGLGTPTIISNTIDNNHAYGAPGGGISLRMTDAQVLGNEFYDNTTDEGGGGLYLVDCDGALLQGNTIDGNDALLGGGGVALENSPNVTLDDNTVLDNWTPESGGGVFFLGSHGATLLDNTIIFNTADIHGGGVGLDGSHGLQASGNTIQGNESGQEGAGWSAFESDYATLTGNDVISNTAGQDGGGIEWYRGFAITLTGNLVMSNTSGGDGGGLRLAQVPTATLTGNDVYSNTATYGGGGAHIEDCDACTLEGNTFLGNVADGGGGLSLVPHGNLTMRDNLIQGNQSSDTAGLHVNEGYVSMDGDRVLNNTSTGVVGGIYVDWATVEAVNLVVADNSAVTDYVGGIEVGADSLLTLTHATVARNTGGPGINLPWDGSPAGLAMTNTIIAGHTVGVQVEGSSSALINGVLWDPATPVTVTHWATSTVAVHNQIVGDPAFDTDGYHLTLGSAAIDQGVDSGVPEDIDGESRPYGLGYDLGADEAHLDEDIAGLEAHNDGPTELGQMTTLSATITAGNYVSYAWSFGDGEYGAGQVVEHTYPDVGTYAAVVTATNNANQMTASTEVTVTDVAIAGLAATNDGPTVFNQVTHLTATISAGTNVSYQWSLDDGTYASGPTVSHQYGALGVYTAVVTATNTANQRITSTVVTVFDVPITGLAATNDGPTELNQVTNLTATISAGSNVTYQWALGDGAYAAGPTLSHQYGAVGVYTAVVTATNGVGPQVASTLVTVQDVPVSGLTVVNDSPTDLGFSTTLTATAQGSNVVYEWDLGNGTYASGSVVEYAYPAAGVYTAVITASNGFNAEIGSTQVTVIERFCYVRLNDDPQLYDSIQEAVEASDSIDDVIKVSGTCQGVSYLGYNWQQVYLTKTVTVRGGYNSSFTEWDPEAYPTVLDAQGGGRVVYIYQTSGTPITPTLEALHLTNGVHASDGGGIKSYYVAQPVISACHIYSNTAQDAGGIYARGPITLVGNQVYENRADRYGGGLYLYLSQDVVIEDNLFTDNTAGAPGVGYGAGAYLKQNTSVALQGNTFRGNYSTQDAGGILLTQNTDVTLRDNTFSDNQAGNNGGGVLASGETGLEIRDNILHHNAGIEGAGIDVLNSPAAIISDNEVYDNDAAFTVAGYGGGINLSTSDGAWVESNQVYNNASISVGGGIRLYDTDGATLVGNDIHHNNAYWDGGGLFLYQTNEITLTGNTLYRNYAEQAGGGMRALSSYTLTLVNNMVLENWTSNAWQHAGLDLSGGNVVLAHNTVAGNYGTGVHWAGPGNLVMTDTLLVSNTVGIYVNNANANMEATLWGGVDWANVVDWSTNNSTLVTGTVNYWSDPAFVDVPTGNYHLLPGSPGVDQGVDAGVLTDIDGDARPYNGLYDIGADEVEPDDPPAGASVTSNSPVELNTLSVLSASVTGGDNVVYDWDLGDGEYAHGPVVEHLYPAVGTYTAVVTASNSTDSGTASTVVTITHNAPIVGLWGVTDRPTALGRPTEFSAFVSAGTGVIYDWDFGDNTAPVLDGGASVDHTYASAGDYTAVVTATNSRGTLTDTVPVQVVRACYVRLNDTPTDYATLQAALDASQSGDLVKVSGTCVDEQSDGGHSLVAYVQTDVTIRGGYSADFALWVPDLYPTTLDAVGQQFVLEVHHNNSVTLESLRLTGGAVGGLTTGGADLVISDCEIDHNGLPGQASNTGGLYVWGNGDLELTGSRIHHNLSTTGGGGALIYVTGAVTVTDNAIHDNVLAEDKYGGGLLISGAASVSLVGNQITDNLAPGFGWGGGLYVGSTYLPTDGLVMFDNLLRNNTAYYGGGAYLDSAGAALSGNWILDNQAAGQGAGLRFLRSATLENNVVAGNGGAWPGTGIEINGGAAITMVHTTLASNEYLNDFGNPMGAAVYVASGSIVMTNTIIVDHQDGIYLSPGTSAIMEGTLWGSGAWANTRDWWEGSATMITGTVNLWAEPGFVNPTNGNYHLLASSAAVDQGVPGTLITDIDGDARPLDGGPDLGADEYAPDVPLAGLAASNDGPTLEGESTNLVATLSAGTNADFLWDFGDGTSGSGAEVYHVFPVAGVYQVTVTATNNLGQLEASTEVIIMEPVQSSPGGDHTTTDGALTFYWPPDMTGAMQIIYTPQADPTNDPGDFTFAGMTFHLDGLDEDGDPIVDISPPISLTIHYEESALPPGFDEAWLTLYRFDTGSGLWVAPTQVLDTGANTILVWLDHLSEFALMGAEIVEQPTIYLPLVLRSS